MASSVGHALANDSFRLWVDPAFGCRWLSLQSRAAGTWRELLWTAPSHDEQLKRPYEFGAYLMAPWCNRVPGGFFRFRRYGHALRPNFPDGSAIHGDVFGRPWKPSTATPDRYSAMIDSLLFSDFNFPWPIRVRHDISLDGPRIHASMSVESRAKDPIPVGFGFHPFFLRRLTPAGTEAHLEVHADRVYPSENGVPTGPAGPAKGALDLSGGVSIKGRTFDHAFTGLGGQAVRLTWIDEDFSLTLASDPELDHLFVFAPALHNGKPSPFICVEPMSHAVNGFNLLEEGWPDTGVRILNPGEVFSASWTLTAGRAS